MSKLRAAQKFVDELLVPKKLKESQALQTKKLSDKQRKQTKAREAEEARENPTNPASKITQKQRASEEKKSIEKSKPPSPVTKSQVPLPT